MKKSEQILVEINNKIIFLYHRTGETPDHLSHLEELKILKDKYLEAVEEEKRADDNFVIGNKYHITHKENLFDFETCIAARVATGNYAFISLKNGNRLVEPVKEFEFKKSNPNFRNYSFTEIV